VNYQVICESGSDASYDLIVEAILPRPERGYLVEALDPDQTSLGERVLAELPELMPRNDIGYRVRLFQRTPEIWVWRARFEALHEKLGQEGVQS
jgi:hypothetical protein